MEDKLKDFFEIEFNYVARDLTNELGVIAREMIYHDAIERAFGAFQLAMICGMKFRDVEQMYEEYRMKLEVLKNEM